MGRPLTVGVVATVLLLFALRWDAACAQTCPLPGITKQYTNCSVLGKLNATLSWTYTSANGSVDIAFRATPAASAGWVGWGINPTGTKMVGTQALIAFRLSNGSTIVNTYDVKSYSDVTLSNLSFPVTSKSATFESGGAITILATLILPSNKTTVNQVWQVGSAVTNMIPDAHATSNDNKQSLGTVNLEQGTSTGTSSLPHQTLKNRHGVLNVVSWGIMMPIGAMIARYAKTFESADPAWFYLHAFCQSSGYIIGVSGWATGLKLGSYSKGTEEKSHRRIGIALFALGTLQVFALLLRPKKDHKLRVYWNVYHHSVGYSVIVLSIINIFKGYDILDPEKKWKHAYIGVIASLGGIALILEVVTWIIFFQRRSKNRSKAVGSV
uniref:Cytochrome b561 and DOMON domain-containing protein n=1 Tax=Araucaria cunninghamii TaxID=56994 RepID=A0A0D6QTD7_ARACU